MKEGLVSWGKRSEGMQDHWPEPPESVKDWTKPVFSFHSAGGRVRIRHAMEAVTTELQPGFQHW